MKRMALLGMVVLMAGALMVTSMANAARPVFDLGTPTVAVFLPLVLKQPTPTPTNTPTPTATATVTPTPTRTATVPPQQPMIGNLWRENQDPLKTYATNIENIWHWFWIHNTNSTRVYYGILGVNVYKDNNYNFFHTSWNGQNAPNGLLYIDGNGCYGPNSYPCSPNPEGAQQRDTVIVAQPGHYWMTLAICQSSFLACMQPGAAWQNLYTVQFDAIDWTPQPGIVDQATPAPTEPCRLVTDDPRGVYLKCQP